jgi:hypothetical protein
MANAAINAAIMAAAQQQAKLEKGLVDQLKEARALGPRSARALDLTPEGSDKVLESLVQAGHVREAGGGRYWLDEEAMAATKATANRVGLIVVAFLLSVTASLIAIAAAF